MDKRGFTLMEVMIAITILTMVGVILFALAGSLARATQFQEAKITATDDARTGMTFVIRNLRQAANMSINWGSLPSSAISFRAATDADGNGTAVDVGVDLELSAVRTFSRDWNDLNGDGLTVTQLIMEENGQVRVLANGLIPDEDTNANGVLDAGEDTNFNNVLNRGLWFEQAGRGIRVTIQSERSANPQGQMVLSTMVETVVPRN